MPSTCIWIDASTSPCNSNATERPNPHPGHQSSPAAPKGHSVWWCTSGLEKYSNTKASTQHANSIGHRENHTPLLVFIG